MTDVVLVQPKVGDWDTVRSHPALPLALLCASTLVDKEYKVRIIDQRTDKNWKDNLIEELSNEPLCVGITSMTGSQIKYALEVARMVKQHSQVKAVMGGIHASLLPEQTLQNENIDIVVQGEGEATLYELVKHLDENKPLEGVEGLWYKSDGTIKSNPPRPFIDLNELPELPYHLVDVNNYTPEFKGKRTLYMELSRGCPYSCAFCYNFTYHKRKWRALSAEKSFERIKYAAENFNIQNIYFVDDNFFVDLKRAEDLAKLLIDYGHDITWEVQGIRINTVEKMSDEFIKLLEAAGCRKIHFGVESGSARVLKLVKKGITYKQVRSVNQKLKTARIITQYNFMSGFPSETLEDLKETVDLAFELMNTSPNVIISPICNYVPYPGTELFDEALKAGFKIPSTLEGWSNFDYGNIPWMSDERRKLLESLFFSSMFVNGGRGMVSSPLFKLIAETYKPLARYRVKNLAFKFMIESKLKNLFIRG
jgi:radical SAM superfamily enzyme YgiQ (UPF0313 family)